MEISRGYLGNSLPRRIVNKCSIFGFGKIRNDRHLFCLITRTRENQKFGKATIDIRMRKFRLQTTISLRSNWFKSTNTNDFLKGKNVYELLSLSLPLLRPLLSLHMIEKWRWKAKINPTSFYRLVYKFSIFALVSLATIWTRCIIDSNMLIREYTRMEVVLCMGGPRYFFRIFRCFDFKARVEFVLTRRGKSW